MTEIPKVVSLRQSASRIVGKTAWIVCSPVTPVDISLILTGSHQFPGSPPLELVYDH